MLLSFANQKSQTHLSFIFNTNYFKITCANDAVSSKNKYNSLLYLIISLILSPISILFIFIISVYPLVQKKVEKFWAYPSFDERFPPPHSTGGALDLTFVDKCGNILDMGGDIDQMDEKARPDFYKNIEDENAIIFNNRRNLLKEIMIKFEFVQHPNEWWHFSYGDQLWAWKNKKANALYGKI